MYSRWSKANAIYDETLEINCLKNDRWIKKMRKWVWNRCVKKIIHCHCTSLLCNLYIADTMFHVWVVKSCHCSVQINACMRYCMQELSKNGSQVPSISRRSIFWIKQPREPNYTVSAAYILLLCNVSFLLFILSSHL